MEVNAKKSVKKKLPTTLIIGAVLIVVSLALVFVLGFLPDIKTKKAFYGKVETLSEGKLVHATVEDPDAPSGIFENAGYSAVLEDERCEILKGLFVDAFGKVSSVKSEKNTMIGDHEYYVRFRLEDGTKFDFYFKDGEVYTMNGSIRESFKAKSPEAYDAFVNYLSGVIIEQW